MKSQRSMLRSNLYLFTALALAVGMAAQSTAWQDQQSKHKQYKLIDLGTFGGPNFFFNFSGSPNMLLNNSGIATGGADTSIVDPYCFNGPDCSVMHAANWQEGVLTDLGALPRVSRSQLKARDGGGPVSIESGSQTGIRKEPNRREERVSDPHTGRA